MTAVVTFHLWDRNEWDVCVDGESVGTLSRSRPERYASVTNRMWAQDHTKPWLWGFVGDRGVAPSKQWTGGDLRAAKARVAKLLIPHRS